MSGEWFLQVYAHFHDQDEDETLSRHKSFGESPTALGPDEIDFPAWTCATSRASEIFAEPARDDDDDRSG